MHLRKPLLIAATASAIVVSTALPAFAADTATTFSLTGGELTLSVQAGAALTDAASGTTSITGTLGAVTVTDGRGTAETWDVTAGSTVFTGTDLSSSTAVSYTAGAVAETGTITVADGTLKALTTDADDTSVVAPSALSGNNTAGWNPLLTVAMPANALTGDYSGTVTTSIL